MNKTYTNIYIEGVQGSGKSTLLRSVAEKYPFYRVCREGDYSPVELAWCARMTEAEYREILRRYRAITDEIQSNTVREDDMYIVTYTKILTDIPGFHKDLERFEIYNGRKSLPELEQIVRTRYRRFSGTGYLFECAFLQNIVEDLILFHRLSDDKITEFYNSLFGEVQKEHFLLLYLYSDNIAENIRVIRKERSDDRGNEMWYPLMLKYLADSPYGREHGCGDFDDLIRHLEHRQQVELRILREVLQDRAVILPSKRWRVEDVAAYFHC